MTYRQRIVADRYLAAPVALLFNFIAHAFGMLVRRGRLIVAADVRCVVVTKLVGMGSAIHAVPLLRALKQQFPSSRLIFVTLTCNRNLIERLEGVDSVLCLDDRSVWRLACSTLRVMWVMIRLRADMYFDLELYSAFSSLLALFSASRNRIGFCRESTRFKNGIYTHLVYFNTRRSIRQLYLQLGRAVGASWMQDDSLGLLRVDDADRDAVRMKLVTVPGGWRDGESYIVVNPNASELMLERRWPLDNFCKTIQRLTELGHRVVLIGSHSERRYVGEIMGGLTTGVKSHVVNTAGMLNLGELLALIEGAQCVLTNDTGPMHMAIALRRLTVCLFGPVSPDHYGHPGANVETLYAPVFCSPCVHEIEDPPCRGDNYCMQRITVEVVMGAILRLLERDDQHASWTLPLVMEDGAGKPLGVLAAG